MNFQVRINGGTFRMGSDRHYPDEAPEREASVDEFWIDATPVTNDAFATFVEDSGYVTVAERPPRAEDYPGAPVENLVPGSLVFTMTSRPVDLRDSHQWWAWVPGASWRSPTGPGSSLEGLGSHPVVHVAYEDVKTYADWAGKDLPSETEWEVAARGGLHGAEFTWGNDDPQETPQPRANTWQGSFPFENTEVDGWTRTSPVASFQPNGFGLYDMAGNVWEWTSDWYVSRLAESPCCMPDRSPSATDSYDPAQPHVNIPRKVVKGGSHLCTIQYCFRYRPAARQPQMVDSSTSHIGFRCVTRRPKGSGS